MPNVNSVNIYREGDVGVPEHVAEGMDYLRYMAATGVLPAAVSRGLAMLPPRSQEAIQTEILRVGRQGLVLVNDLINQGLVYNLDNWLSYTELTQQRGGGGVNAQQTMDLDVRGERQMPSDLNSYTIPLPATWSDFSEGIRTILMARRTGQPFDVTLVGEATYAINRLIEDQGWNGWGKKVNGNSLPGIFTAPVNVFEYDAWDDPGVSGADIEEFIQGMADMPGEEYPGPFTLYINRRYNSKLNRKYSDGVTTFDTTIRQNLEGMQFGGQNLRIQTVPSLGTDQVALVQMSTNVLDVVMGQTPDTISWQAASGLRFFYMVLAGVWVRIKSDFNGGQGIVVGQLGE
jgi:hypothetical protein